jgi:hypothetical protein
VVVEDGLVERGGEFEGGGHRGEAGDVELGAQGVDAVVERGTAGVADQGGDGGVDRGGAQAEVGEVDFVVGLGVASAAERRSRRPRSRPHSKPRILS